MNYILQLNGFWNWARTNEISHLELDLYMSILDIANGTSWKTQFSIPNSSLGRFDKNSLTRARNKLVQYGLITYQKGKKGQAPVYQVTKLYEEEPTIPNNDTYIDTNTDTNSDTNSDTNLHTNIGNILKQKETKQNNINPIVPYQKIVDLFNSICVSLPKVKILSESRKKTIKVAVKKHTMEDFERLFRKAEDSEFLCGSNNQKWTATFDWLIKDSNMAKVFDGNYDNKNGTAKSETAFSDNTYNHDDLEILTRRK